jgi:hypothetical protein
VASSAVNAAIACSERIVVSDLSASSIRADFKNYGELIERALWN